MESVDIYCERLGPAFWAEPANAGSNLAFFIASLLALALAHRLRVARDPTVLWLVFLIAAIGTGSFLFHTLATVWASMADVIPIVVFQVSFIALYARNVARLSAGRSLMLLVGFFALSTLMSKVPSDLFNGSNAYFSAIIYLAGFAIYHRMSHKAAPNALHAAVGIFLVSLILRTIDQGVCDTFPSGTHMFWHILNGAVLYLVARAYIMNRMPRTISCH